MSYEATIGAWAAAARQRVLEDVKQLTNDTQFAIVAHTAIDTGRARSSWNIAAGENADLSVTPELVSRTNPISGDFITRAPAGASPLTRSQAFTAARGQHQVADAATAPLLTISNNLDYILGLENGTGSSQFAPGAMFTNNVFIAADVARQWGYVPRLA